MKTILKITLITIATISFFACTKGKDEDTHAEQEYFDYLVSTKFENDMQTFLHMAVSIESARLEYLSLTSDDFTTAPFEGRNFDKAKAFVWHAHLDEIAANEDHYMAAFNSLVDAKVLETITPGTRSLFDTGGKFIDFIQCLSGEHMRMVNIALLSKLTTAQLKKVYEEEIVRYAPHTVEGTEKANVWFEKMKNGELNDDYAGRIYQTLMGDDGDVSALAQEMKLDPQNVSRKRAVEMFVKGSELSVALSQLGIKPSFSLSDEVKDAAKAAGKAVKNWLFEPEQIEKAAEKEFEKYEGLDWYEGYQKEQKGQFVKAMKEHSEVLHKDNNISFSSTDTDYAAVGVAVSQEGSVSVAVGVDESGKVVVPVKDEGEHTFTAIDDDNDKFTCKVDVKPGVNNISGSTNEKEVWEDILTEEKEKPAGGDDVSAIIGQWKATRIYYDYYSTNGAFDSYTTEPQRISIELTIDNERVYFSKINSNFYPPAKTDQDYKYIFKDNKIIYPHPVYGIAEPSPIAFDKASSHEVIVVSDDVIILESNKISATEPNVNIVKSYHLERM